MTTSHISQQIYDGGDGTIWHSGKNTNACTQLRSFVLSIPLSLSQLHYNEDPHQDPASIKLQNKCTQHHLSLCLQTQTQNMNPRHANFIHTPNIISIRRRTHILPSSPF